MGKLICDSTPSSPLTPWNHPSLSPSLTPSLTSSKTSSILDSSSVNAPLTPWEKVSGLEEQQRRHLTPSITPSILDSSAVNAPLTPQQRRQLTPSKTPSILDSSAANAPLTPQQRRQLTPSILDSSIVNAPLTAQQRRQLTPSVTASITESILDCSTVNAPLTPWEKVSGLEEQQRRHLKKLQAEGVLWKHKEESIVFRLSHGGEVEADGNCLFTALSKGMTEKGEKGGKLTAKELRRRTVERFLMDLGSCSEEEKLMIELAIKNMYNPDLKCGWGIHVVQEFKLLAKKSERESLDASILELTELDMQRELAAESIYKERCMAVDDGASWAKYMLISGSPDDEFDIISLQYTEEGLLTVDENRDGRAAAFGDDIAIECLATEFKREIFVVQAHGSDAMVDEDNCVFFLPHRPKSEICKPPFFLFMKGTGWCGAGADHYEPLIAHPSPSISTEKVALVL